MLDSAQLSQRAISDQEPTLSAHIDRLISTPSQNLKRESALDIGEWIRFLAFDIIVKASEDFEVSRTLHFLEQ
ncbi:hypothetical protein K458DRAFT_384503 [Lentithecium fluviatile CBS 122367]|uniref:Uncharacterized protein n=1 Tax=Lentithecium fluviatile CBS 122367 TaxID=1168545 RepID=A0A6G1JDW3_9PLEO|nr:hypothetical protein K458DRAFT_384503 [Lentithecium fluviatile CBS 122367]